MIINTRNKPLDILQLMKADNKNEKDSMKVRCDGNHLWTVREMKTNKDVTLSMDAIVRIGIDHFLFPTTNGGWMKAKARKIPAGDTKVKCIKVDSDDHLYALNVPGGHGRKDLLMTHNTGGGKSVLQRNVIFHILAHYKQIKFLGIDLKRVELSKFKKYSMGVIGIATTLPDAVEVLRFSQKSMMDRYGKMEAVGKNNFLDMDNAGAALLVMIDEAGELLDTSAPAKALVGSTFVPNLEGRPNLKSIRKGDHVLAEDCEWHRVIDKYSPENQDRYSITIVRDADGSEDTFIMGAQHAWTFLLNGTEPTSDDGENDPIVLTAEQFDSIWSDDTPEERKLIHLYRTGVGNGLIEACRSGQTDSYRPDTSTLETYSIKEFLKLDPDDEDYHADDQLYCLRVDSPEHEFLIGRMAVPTHNSDDAKAQAALKGEAQSMVGSIARLGRAAGTHLLVATQRPDAKLLPGELKSNLGMRAACGQMNPTASMMTLDSGSATRTPGNPKGRAVLKIYENEYRCQVYFADPDWIDGWLQRRNLNPDGTPLSTGETGLLADDHLDDLKDRTMDEIQGISNDASIEELRRRDAEIKRKHAEAMKEQGVTTDMPGLEEEDDEDKPDMTGGLGRPKLGGTVNDDSVIDEEMNNGWDDGMDALKEAGMDDDEDEDNDLDDEDDDDFEEDDE